MIKLEVELKDEKFHYSYTIGENKQTASMHLSADHLVLFTDLLRACSAAFKYDEKQWERKVMQIAYEQKMAELAKDGAK